MGSSELVWVDCPSATYETQTLAAYGIRIYGELKFVPKKLLEEMTVSGVGDRDPNNVEVGTVLESFSVPRWLAVKEGWDFDE